MPPPLSLIPHPISVEEEKLADTLVSRGLITREEWQQVRTTATGSGLGVMLAGLVKTGFLTAAQAQRALSSKRTRATLQIPGHKLLDKIGPRLDGHGLQSRQLSNGPNRRDQGTPSETGREQGFPGALFSAKPTSPPNSTAITSFKQLTLAQRETTIFS